jgi:hypothetical protein
MKPIFMQLREARKANAIPLNLWKASIKIGATRSREPLVESVKQIRKEFDELVGYGIYKPRSWLRFLKRQVRNNKKEGYRLI